MTDKTCETCGGVLVRRRHEPAERWAERRFCGPGCVGRSRAVRPAPLVDLERLRGQRPSVREMQVVELVARGMTNLQIGAELHLSHLTVKGHLMRVGVKLGISDRAGIVGAAICRGDLQVPVTGSVPDGFDKDLFDVLVRIARGRSNSEIATELNLGFEQTKRRVRRLLAVLGVRNREQAVAAGVACGALPLVRRRERVAA